ncbi:MAG TPA: glutathione S-transferase N-terminal domain-containing protein [Gemmatimonadaceae bacterium]|nr:glutathione S-transferase N-terminal domain-containing protein [Gemmatimonadaceae bacterium]
MKLFGTYLSPFARRVAVALASRAIPYEHDDLNGYADPGRARALNPVGKVPVLVLDDDEHLIDSSAILDYLGERVADDEPLVPRSGRERRAALRLAAIATTIYEQSTARYFEERRPGGCVQPDLIERYRRQTVGGLKALDAACGPDGPIGGTPLGIATISAVVAFDYARMMHPDLDLAEIAPVLTAVAESLADDPAFARTRPHAAESEEHR